VKSAVHLSAKQARRVYKSKQPALLLSFCFTLFDVAVSGTEVFTEKFTVIKIITNFPIVMQLAKVFIIVVKAHN
jgi:hypothetical protein